MEGFSMTSPHRFCPRQGTAALALLFGLAACGSTTTAPGTGSGGTPPPTGQVDAGANRPALAVSATADRNRAISGTDIRFSATATGGSGNYTFRWDMGDGSNRIDGRDVSYSYREAGTFNATVEAVDTAGARGSAYVAVTVLAADGGTGGTSDLDLTISPQKIDRLSPNPPAGLIEGSPFTIKFTVRNSGIRASGSFDYQIYAKAFLPDSRWKPIGPRRQHASLGANTSDQVTVETIVPSGFTGGQQSAYDLKVSIDPDNVIPESKDCTAPADLDVFTCNNWGYVEGGAEICTAPPCERG
jgi:hypothetical protein